MFTTRLQNFGAPAVASFTLRFVRRKPVVKPFAPHRSLHGQRHEMLGIAGNGIRGLMGKPFDGCRSRGFSSLQQGPGSGKGNWLMAIGTAALGIGGAAYAYTQMQSGKLLGSSTGKCTEEDCGCVEKKCGDSDCLRRMEKDEELIAKANQDLEKALKDVKPKAVELTEAGLKAYCEASDMIKLFMDKSYCGIDEENLESPRFEEVWCDIQDISVKRCEKVKDAMQKGQCAWDMLCRLREVIENGKACKYTSCNPLLLTAEETLCCAEREILDAKSKMDCIQSESRLVDQYQSVVGDFRRELKAEVDSVVTSPDCSDTFTCNECSMIITHAYKKVLRIQKELAQVQACAAEQGKGSGAGSGDNCGLGGSSNGGCNKC